MESARCPTGRLEGPNHPAVRKDRLFVGRIDGLSSFAWASGRIMKTRFTSIMAALSRYVWRIGRTLAVIVSLLTFPSMIPWMVACWLAWYTLLSSHNRLRLPLLACVGILLVKRVDWSPWLIAMAVLMLALFGYRRYAERKVPSPWNNRLAWLGVAGIWIAWAGVTYQWGRSPYAGRPLTIQPSRPVVCIGDSLTSFGYPKCLREKVSLPVRDLSYPGITSGEALLILPRLVEAKPQVVVIELGGHDYLQGNGRAATRRNLDKIVNVARSIGAEVILMEIPRGFVMDAYDGLEPPDGPAGRTGTGSRHGDSEVGAVEIPPPRPARRRGRNIGLATMACIPTPAATRSWQNM